MLRRRNISGDVQIGVLLSSELVQYIPLRLHLAMLLVQSSNGLTKLIVQTTERYCLGKQ